MQNRVEIRHPMREKSLVILFSLGDSQFQQVQSQLTVSVLLQFRICSLQRRGQDEQDKSDDLCSECQERQQLPKNRRQPSKRKQKRKQISK